MSAADHSTRHDTPESGEWDRGISGHPPLSECPLVFAAAIMELAWFAFRQGIASALRVALATAFWLQGFLKQGAAPNWTPSLARSQEPALAAG